MQHLVHDTTERPHVYGPSEVAAVGVGGGGELGREVRGRAAVALELAVTADACEAKVAQLEVEQLRSEATLCARHLLGRRARAAA